MSHYPSNVIDSGSRFFVSTFDVRWSPCYGFLSTKGKCGFQISMWTTGFSHRVFPLGRAGNYLWASKDKGPPWCVANLSIAFETVDGTWKNVNLPGGLTVLEKICRWLHLFKVLERHFHDYFKVLILLWCEPWTLFLLIQNACVQNKLQGLLSIGLHMSWHDKQ